MKNITLKAIMAVILLGASLFSFSQWTPVIDGVLPQVIAISPAFSTDHTVYMADDEIRLYVSEDAGTVWTLLYEASDPWAPSQMILDVVLSPDFGNDHTMIMIHMDGSCGMSTDRGHTWNPLMAPAGISGIVFSPSWATDKKLFGVTGLAGLVDFYEANNSGANWEQVSQVFVGFPSVARIWTSQDVDKQNWFAVTVEEGAKLLISGNDGLTWALSLEPELPIYDLALSPGFSLDHTLFIATATHIFKNTEQGNPLHWVPVKSVSDGWGFRLAISPDFLTDETLYYTLNGVGIGRTLDGGSSWEPFMDGFTSTLPISIKISDKGPFTLFAGSEDIDVTPDKLWKYQFPLAISEPGESPFQTLSCSANPFPIQTTLTFSLKQAGNVHLYLFDASGKQRATLIDKHMAAGEYDIDLSVLEYNLKPGLYICQMKTERATSQVKLVVSKN